MNGIGSIFGRQVGNAALNSIGVKTHAVQTGGLAITGVSGLNPNWSGMSQFAPERRDPFEYACEVAAKQPADKKWRRFQQAIFKLDDVIAVTAEGSGSICVQIRLCNSTRQEVFTLPFECQDPAQWFAEHVMGMEFPNVPHAT